MDINQEMLLIKYIIKVIQVVFGRKLQIIQILNMEQVYFMNNTQVVKEMGMKEQLEEELDVLRINLKGKTYGNK